MISHILIVADIGTLKAYQISERSLVHRKKIELIKKITYTNAHRKLSDQLSDGRGSFRGSGDARSPRHGSGEAHHLKGERDKRAVCSIAHDIEGVISHTPADAYYLSLPQPIHRAVTEEIQKNIRSKITKELDVDLTKDTIEDIRKRFGV